MEDIKKYIQSKLNNIEAELKRAKSNKVNFIAQKNQLLDMLFLIEIYEKYDISRKNIDKIVILPNTKTDISEYKLMEDNDLDDKQYWQELVIEEEKIKLCAPSGASVRCTFTLGDTGGQAVTYEQATSSDSAGAGPVLCYSHIKVIKNSAIISIGFIQVMIF